MSRREAIRAARLRRIAAEAARREEFEAAQDTCECREWIGWSCPRCCRE